MTDYDDYGLYDEDDERFDEPPNETVEVIDLRKFLIAGLAADAADDDAIAGRSPQDLDWQDDGLCKESDPEAFFPEKGGSTREAKRICLGCEVKDACLEYALANDERFGIWGGLSERERRRIKRGVI